MTSTNIALVLISGLGVLHGFFLSIILWNYGKTSKSNKILSVLLFVLSLRVGKSVFLEFTEHLEIKLIFIGLSTLMAIGPLFYLYMRSLIEKEFEFKKNDWLHFVPLSLGLVFGIWMSEEAADTLPKLFFVFLFVMYYGHYLTYLVISYSRVYKKKKAGLKGKTNRLLRLLFFGLLSLWFVYVLNLFDEFVPYIIGPILYTVIAYAISIIIIRKGYINITDGAKYKTTAISQNQIDDIFRKVDQVVAKDQEYKNPNLSLRTLSEKLKLSTQVLSMVINKESKSNFNSYINHYRIEESMVMFLTKKYDHYTIASIAFEVGFNSLTSFNTAFKKQIGKTPLAFRNEQSK